LRNNRHAPSVGVDAVDLDLSDPIIQSM